METFSSLLTLCVGNSSVTGEFPAQRPVKRGFDVFFDLRLNKRLSKQSWGWWYDSPSRPLWRYCNAEEILSEAPYTRLATCCVLGLLLVTWFNFNLSMIEHILLDVTWMQMIAKVMLLARQDIEPPQRGMPSSWGLLRAPLLPNFTYGTTCWTHNRFGSSASRVGLYNQMKYYQRHRAHGGPLVVSWDYF